MRTFLVAPVAAALAIFGSSPRTAVAAEPYSFVVLGHLRGQDNGRLNPLLDELVAEAAALGPELAFVTGDSIWGYVRELPDPAAAARRDWEALDAKLRGIGAPVHRVPGNHDIACPDTRDVYFERYEPLPRAFTHRGSRFILLNTTFVPEGDAPSRRYVLTRRLDAEQVEFLRRELADVSGFDHVFVFMHHVLWWFEDAPWWEDVHPLLAAAGVRAVFSGDYGPQKFSHMRRDGIDYVRTAIEDKYSLDRGEQALEALRASEEDRTLAGQFDNFLHVSVDGDDVAIEVRNVGALSSGKWSPDRYRAVYGELTPREGLVYDPARPAPRDAAPGWMGRLRALAGGGRRAGVTVVLLVLAFGAGIVIGRARGGAR